MNDNIESFNVTSNKSTPIYYASSNLSQQGMSRDIQTQNIVLEYNKVIITLFYGNKSYRLLALLRRVWV